MKYRGSTHVFSCRSWFMKNAIPLSSEISVVQPFGNGCDRRKLTNFTTKFACDAPLSVSRAIDGVNGGFSSSVSFDRCTKSAKESGRSTIRLLCRYNSCNCCRLRIFAGRLTISLYVRSRNSNCVKEQSASLTCRILLFDKLRLIEFINKRKKERKESKLFEFCKSPDTWGYCGDTVI